jgi:aryl-alcohol dehydrogenase-like predicted oxidoreductase
MPRFQPEHFTRNLQLLDGLAAVAREHDCSMGQLALAWVLAQRNDIVPIPGTTRVDHLEENAEAVDLTLSPTTVSRLDALINPQTVSGARYNAATQTEIDTEELADAEELKSGNLEK